MNRGDTEMTIGEFVRETIMSLGEFHQTMVGVCRREIFETRRDRSDWMERFQHYLDMTDGYRDEGTGGKEPTE